MTDEVLQIVIPAVAGIAGIGITKAYEAYQKKNDKSSKARALDEMYDTLEKMYSEDLKLQKILNSLAKENEDLKRTIENFEDAN